MKTCDLDKLIEAVEAGKWPLDPQPWMTGAIWTNICAAFNGELNAAKALHEELLLDWMMPCIVSHYLNGKHGVTIEIYERGGSGEAIATHDNMARAWLLAILRAYRSQAPALAKMGDKP